MEIVSVPILEQVKILIVDDLENNLMALEGLIRRPDVLIFKARSGSQALEYMILHDFALALIDVQMPIMSGFELAEFMRGTKKTKSIPIIFVTATAKHQSFLFKGYESGAVDFLPKPLDPHAVKSKVNIFVEYYRKGLELNHQLETIIRNQAEQEKLLIRLKQIQADLELAKSAAEKANEFKSAFLANMSHEIRTPLGAILGFVDLLRDPALSATQRINYIDTISRNGESLSVIINDVLDLSKVEAGHLKLEFKNTEPGKICADVVALLSESAKKKGLVLGYNFDLLAPKSIVSDPTRVRQIMLNLVGNAIKFTTTGSVKITSYDCKTKQGALACCFEISDTGIGIPDSQKENIFEMFVQADETMSRRFGGTGLGLALARKLARSLGGDVTIKQSSAGKGSVFLVQIEDQPLLANTESIKNFEMTVKPIDPELNSLANVRVLIADDSADNQFLISHYLKKYGAIVATAENGEIAFNKAMAENFDVVLMDIQMPIMDGYVATRKLREANFQKPIIALTAHAMSEVRQKCLDAGCTSYLTKPINQKELITVITKAITLDAKITLAD